MVIIFYNIITFILYIRIVCQSCVSRFGSAICACRVRRGIICELFAIKKLKAG